MLSAGKSDISSSTSRSASKNGSAPRKMLTIFCFEMAEQTLRRIAHRRGDQTDRQPGDHYGAELDRRNPNSLSAGRNTGVSSRIAGLNVHEKTDGEDDEGHGHQRHDGGNMHLGKQGTDHLRRCTRARILVNSPEKAMMIITLELLRMAS